MSKKIFLNSKNLTKRFALPNFLEKNLSGFTLVETLIALGVFAIVTTIAVGGFVSALKGHRHALAIMAANSNISSAMEQMSREIRTGSAYAIGGNCSSLTFNNAQNEDVVYNLDSVGNFITRTVLGSEEKITDNNVIVSTLCFTVFKPDINHPPRIIINISIKPKVEGVDTSAINFQTTISSRNYQ